jgi:hypothetical protein
VINVTATSRGQFHLESAWEVESSTTWEKYTDEVRGRLPSDYELKRTEAESLHFHKPLDGDSLTVDIKRVSTGPPVRVRVTFRASAG